MMIEALDVPVTRIGKNQFVHNTFQQNMMVGMKVWLSSTSRKDIQDSSYLVIEIKIMK